MNLLEKLKATCEIDSGGHFLLCLFNFMLLIILEIMSLFLGIPNVGYLTIIYNPIVMLFCFCFMGFLIYDY